MEIGFFIYNIAFLFSAFFTWLSSKKLKIFNKKITLSFALGLSYLVVFLLNGSRDYVGTDYEHYKWIYDIAQNGEFYAVVEPGYWFVNKLFVNFNYGHRYVLAFMVIITYLNIYILSKREHIEMLILPFVFAIGFIQFSNNIVRQSYTITLFFLAIKYIENRRFWYYLLFVFCISLFHLSGLMLFPFYWIGRVRIKRKIWPILFFLSIVVYKLNLFRIVISFVASFIPKYASFVGKKGHDDFSGNFGLTIILIILFGLVINYFSKYLDENNRRGQVYFNLFMIGTCLSIMLFSSNYFYRFTFYFSFLPILLMPLIVKNIKKRKLRQTVFFVFFIITLVWWLKALVFNDGDPLPYNSFLI